MVGTHLPYKRSRFSTRLPADRLYAPSHAWLREESPGLWRVGFTKFATRILGEPVELDFEVQRDAAVRVGETVGWVEGFKAVTDLFCPLPGQFANPNPALEQDIAAIQSDPYGKGWLYAVAGTPPEDCVDANGYAGVLDAAIDKMLGKTL